MVALPKSDASDFRLDFRDGRGRHAECPEPEADQVGDGVFAAGQFATEAQRGAAGDVHNKYFNPYESPYDSYINFMNVLDNVRTRLRG